MFFSLPFLLFLLPVKGHLLGKKGRKKKERKKETKNGREEERKKGRKEGSNEERTEGRETESIRLVTLGVDGNPVGPRGLGVGCPCDWDSEAMGSN